MFLSTPYVTVENARMWHVLDDADLARLRSALMHELAWIDEDPRRRGWRQEHAALLTVKLASLVPREAP